MGAENSKESSRNRNDNIISELRVEMNTQREFYENKCKELLEGQKKVMTNPQQTLTQPQQTHHNTEDNRLHRSAYPHNTCNAVNAPYNLYPSLPQHMNNIQQGPPTMRPTNSTPGTSTHRDLRFRPSAPPESELNIVTHYRRSCRGSFDADRNSRPREHTRTAGSAETSNWRNNRIQCFHESLGCTLTFNTIKSRSYHVWKECIYRKQQCPVQSLGSQCNWSGNIKEIEKHFYENHPVCLSLNSNDNKEDTLHLGCSYRTLSLVIRGPFVFLININVDICKNKIYILPQLYGSKVSADKWTCEVRIYNEMEPNRQYSHKGLCLSNAESFSELCAADNVHTICLDYAKTFTTDDIVTYKIILTRENDRKPRSMTPGSITARFKSQYSRN